MARVARSRFFLSPRRQSCRPVFSLVSTSSDLLLPLVSRSLPFRAGRTMDCDLSKPQAIVWSLAMGSAYVGSLYLVPWRWRRLPRDVPAHIRARFVAVGFATVSAVGAFARVTRGGACFGGVGPALGASRNRRRDTRQVRAGVVRAVWLPVLLTACVASDSTHAGAAFCMPGVSQPRSSSSTTRESAAGHGRRGPRCEI